jgi:hypothetical protein
VHPSHLTAQVVAGADRRQAGACRGRWGIDRLWRVHAPDHLDQSAGPRRPSSARDGLDPSLNHRVRIEDTSGRIELDPVVIDD